VTGSAILTRFGGSLCIIRLTGATIASHAEHDQKPMPIKSCEDTGSRNGRDGSLDDHAAGARIQIGVGGRNACREKDEQAGEDDSHKDHVRQAMLRSYLMFQIYDNLSRSFSNMEFTLG
jgi:hypothetical protein